MTVFTSLAVPTPVVHDRGMADSTAPRAGGPSRRRSFTPEQKLQHLEAYEAACVERRGGAYLRQTGLYSSQVTEWRRLRDSGLLDGKQPGEPVGRPTAEQAEIARLKRRLADAEQQLSRTEVALQIMGKAHELLEDLSKGSPAGPRDERS